MQTTNKQTPLSSEEKLELMIAKWKKDSEELYKAIKKGEDRKLK